MKIVKWGLSPLILLFLVTGWDRAQTTDEPLQLPPGLLEVLPLNETASVMADVVRVANCPDDDDNPLGTCGNVLFGGNAIYSSPLSGFVQIRFFPPVNGVSHFEVTHPGNLVGIDSLMDAPELFSFQVTDNYLLQPVGRVASGDFDLFTGEVTNFSYPVFFSNSFYDRLADVNPNLRGDMFEFPGAYGNVDVQFEQRSDGLLDFTMSASTFLPLGNNIEGDPVRFPLPFCGPLLYCAGFEAPGTSLHPRIRLTTKESSAPICDENCPPIPENAVRQFTLLTADSQIADRFNLNIGQLGDGLATARSKLQGRVQLQFGPRSGNLIPFVFGLLPPSGLIAEPPEGEIPLPSGLSIGAIGHDGDLDFQLQTYRFEDLAIFDDPFDLAVGFVDTSTGAVLGDLTYRGFFIQSLLVQVLLQNQGRIPQASFPFRGPAAFHRHGDDGLQITFNGQLHLPYGGLIFPSPDYNPAHGYQAGPGSELNPRVSLTARSASAELQLLWEGSGDDVVSTIGERFSYRYSVSCDPGNESASFEYENFTGPNHDGRFVMKKLSSASCMVEADREILTFGGFGTWNGEIDEPHLATVQITRQFGNGEDVSILIDGGLVSQAAAPNIP